MPLKVTRQRLHKTKATREHARQIIADVQPGEGLLCLLREQAATMDLIEACCQHSPGQRLLVVTWSIGLWEATRLRQLIDSRAVADLVVIVDTSYGARQRQDADTVADLIGPYIRTCSVHAKIAVVGDWCLLGSGNLNRTVRIEQISIERNAELAAWLWEQWAGIIDTPTGLAVSAESQAQAKTRTAGAWYGADQSLDLELDLSLGLDLDLGDMW